ncbi:MAG: hypothetical protein ACI30S_04000 [Muribaculaceae bacterium]
MDTIRRDSPSHEVGGMAYDQASSLRSLPGLSHNSMLSEPAGWLQPRLMERTGQTDNREETVVAEIEGIRG